MAPNPGSQERKFTDEDIDPREAERDGAQVIDLATRNVMPRVSQRKRRDSIGLAAGIAVVAALGALTLWSMDGSRQTNLPVSHLPNGGQAPGQDAKRPASVVPASGSRDAANTPLETQTGVASPRSALAPPSLSPVLANRPGAAIGSRPASNRHASPTMIFDATGLPGTTATTFAPKIAGKGNPNDDFAARIGGVGGTKATARSTFDPKTTVTQGTLIPAVLETAIDTSVPGYVRAIVSTDVRSFDGARVLVPRSSRLIGQYKSGMQAGQKRAYVVWTRLIRPDGVSVNLGSPAVGFSGKTGIAGKVDGHFFERFGSAMLLSVVGGLSAIGGNTGVIIGGGGQSAAAAAVNQNSKLGPTIRVRQGEPIRVFTAKDLDFSKVD